jgi:hypothetical protein
LNSLPSGGVLPRPTGIQAGNDQAPTEPPNRLKYLELTVSGLNDGDSQTLTTTLDKVKGSRGATVRRKGAGDATVKVWYSERDPLEADDVIQAVGKLGFKAVMAGG